MLTYTEENYLKTIYHLSSETNEAVSTNAIAEALETKAASVTDMVQKLAAKDLATYLKYKGVNLTQEGTQAALQVIRKHRLWEVFLVEELKFKWDEVHEVAEQLEHINSSILIERLDEYLQFPKFDPHGDPIPDMHGKMAKTEQRMLSEIETGKTAQIATVKDGNKAFLRYLDKIGASIGASVKVLDRAEFDGSLEISIDSQAPQFISKEVAQSILITDSK